MAVETLFSTMLRCMKKYSGNCDWRIVQIISGSEYNYRKKLENEEYEDAYESSKKLMWYGFIGSVFLSFVIMLTKSYYPGYFGILNRNGKLNHEKSEKTIYDDWERLGAWMERYSI